MNNLFVGRGGVAKIKGRENVSKSQDSKRKDGASKWHPNERETMAMPFFGASDPGGGGTRASAL